LKSKTKVRRTLLWVSFVCTMVVLREDIGWREILSMDLEALNENTKCYG